MTFRIREQNKVSGSFLAIPKDHYTHASLHSCLPLHVAPTALLQSFLCFIVLLRFNFAHLLHKMLDVHLLWNALKASVLRRVSKWHIVRIKGLLDRSATLLRRLIAFRRAAAISELTFYKLLRVWMWLKEAFTSQLARQVHAKTTELAKAWNVSIIFVLVPKMCLASTANTVSVKACVLCVRLLYLFYNSNPIMYKVHRWGVRSKRY